jgi:hypothetical protein
MILILKLIRWENYVLWDTTPCKPVTNVSEEHIAHIFKFEEKAKQEKIMKQAARRDFPSNIMPVDLHRTTRRYVPEDGTVHIQICENSDPVPLRAGVAGHLAGMDDNETAVNREGEVRLGKLKLKWLTDIDET